MSLALLPRDRAQEIGVGLIILAALAKPRLCLSLNVCFFRHQRQSHGRRQLLQAPKVTCHQSPCRKPVGIGGPGATDSQGFVYIGALGSCQPRGMSHGTQSWRMALWIEAALVCLKAWNASLGMPCPGLVKRLFVGLYPHVQALRPEISYRTVLAIHRLPANTKSPLTTTRAAHFF